MTETLSPKDHFGFTFVTLARRWRRAIDLKLLDSGLTDATWTPLIHLRRADEPMTQSELAHRIGLDTSSLVRLLDQLEAKGMVERRVDPKDRRARLLQLTTLGQQEVERLSRDLTKIERELLSGFSDDDIAALLRAFEVIASNVQTIIDKS
jgi:MarR family transcriptional regulator for hemolysin